MTVIGYRFRLRFRFRFRFRLQLQKRYRFPGCLYLSQASGSAHSGGSCLRHSAELPANVAVER